MSNPTYLVIDVGGTNTRLALTRGTELRADTIARFRNQSLTGLDRAIAEFLGRHSGESIDGVCAGVAGPVEQGIAKLTNVEWVVSADMLRASTGADLVTVINDLQAQGQGLDALKPESTPVLLDGPVATGEATRLVINLGTGFNSIPVYRLGDQVLTPASETGHMTLPGQTRHSQLIAALTDWFGYPTIERALSGQGLSNLYRHFGGAKDSEADQIMAALQTGDPVAERAVRLLVDLLGLVAGDLALASLPYGGIFLTGGVAGHMAPHLDQFGFGAAFRNKGDFTKILQQFRISLIADDYAALRGSARYLGQLARD